MLAERVRESVATAPLGDAYGERAMTISVGAVASSLDVTESVDDLIARADAALYAAKGSRRDRVVIG